MAHILIVAPDTELRKSVEFVLGAEGYEITSRASIAARESPAYACTVLDQHAIGADWMLAAKFCSIFAPVVLLTSQLPHPLTGSVFATLLKPLLGPALISAVNDAVASPPPK